MTPSGLTTIMTMTSIPVFQTIQTPNLTGVLTPYMRAPNCYMGILESVSALVTARLNSATPPSSIPTSILI